jgi:hypothetical protein
VLLQTQVFWGVAAHRLRMVTKRFQGAVILLNNSNYLPVNMLLYPIRLESSCRYYFGVVDAACENCQSLASCIKTKSLKSELKLLFMCKLL